MNRIDEIVQMADEIRKQLVYEYCIGCRYDSPSQREHTCMWDSGHEYKMEALAMLYGRGHINEDEYSEAINYL
jgi:hypothetical protein